MYCAGDLCKQIWSHAEILISHVLKFTDLNCWFWDCKCTVALAKYLLNLFNPTQYNFRFVPFVLTLNTSQLWKFSSRRNTCINYLIFSQLSGRAYPHRQPSPHPPPQEGDTRGVKIEKSHSLRANQLESSALWEPSSYEKWTGQILLPIFH